MPVTVITLITSFKDQLLTLCSDIKKEVEFFLDNGLKDYIESIESKFANTKTFLYRNEEVPFYDVFFPVSLEIKDLKRKITSPHDLFKKTRFINIIGVAGCGKTMLMKHFFLASIKDSFKIPLFIELRSLNNYDGSFTEFIYEIIFNNKLSPNQKILERILESGSFILLLDGYDEIYSSKKDKITNDLDKFIDRYSKNNFIISSRPGSGIESLQRFNNYFVKELSDREVFEFIDLVLKGTSDKENGIKIKDVITKSTKSDYSNFLRSPLLLSMFILTFNTYPELPKKKSKFYWNVFDTLATKHDSFTKKAGYQHERKTGLYNEDFEKILQWFSYRSLFQGKFTFDSEYFNQKLNEIKSSLKYDFSTADLIQDLTLAISIIIIDGVEYKFPHKSLQEYFCAMLIKEQSDEVKSKIYGENFRIFIDSSTGGYDNLWNLCLELDKVNFLKYFIVPNLREFKKVVENPDRIIQLKNFYEFSELTDHISIEEQNEDDEVSGALSHSAELNVYNGIIKYLNMGELTNYTFGSLVYFDADIDHDIVNYCKSIKSTLEKSDVFDGGYLFKISDHWNKRIISNLKKLKFDVMISDIVTKVDIAITDFNKSIENEERATDLLIGL